MKVLVAGASVEELSIFKKAGFLTAPLGTGLVLSAVNAAIAIKELEPDIIINVGTAGTFSRRFEIGSVHSFSSVMNRDQDLSAYHLKRGATIDAHCRTVAEIDIAGPEKYRLLSSSAFCSTDCDFADAADMEAYSVAYAGLRLKKKCAVFKLITDNIGQKVLLADYRRFLREGRELLLSNVSDYISSIK